MKNEKKNTEFEHFSSLANDWWSKNGKFKILHDILPIRIKYILEAINKKRPLVPVPLFMAKAMASVFELMPNPLLTNDQLKLLKYDNILSNKYTNNASIGVPSRGLFLDEVKKYSYMWKVGGEYSKEKYNPKGKI